nr:hypothetical protein [Tanacetum cinerariifolium]
AWRCWEVVVEVVGGRGELCGVRKWREKGLMEWQEILCVAEYFECKDREGSTILNFTHLVLGVSKD